MDIPRRTWIMFYLAPVALAALAVLGYARVCELPMTTRAVIAIVLVLTSAASRIIPRSWPLAFYLAMIVALACDGLSMFLFSSMIDALFIRRFAFALSTIVTLFALTRYYLVLDAYLNVSRAQAARRED